MPVGWKHSYPRVVKRAVQRGSDASHRRTARDDAGAMDLPALPRRRPSRREVWALFLVKNEEDIIGQSVSHALGQGCDHVLVVDNGSSDRTVEIVRSLRDERVHLGFDRLEAYYQAHKMSFLARWARRHGAGWVVPVDADEFWYVDDGLLADHLRCHEAPLVEGEITNVFPTTQTPVIQGLSGVPGSVRWDHTVHALHKVALRTHPLAWINMGNHSAVRPGLTVGGIRIVHVPWRSYEQFARKMRQGAAALAKTSLDAGTGGHWRAYGGAGEEQLRAKWSQILNGETDDSIGWTPRGPFTVTDPHDWPPGRWPGADLTA